MKCWNDDRKSEDEFFHDIYANDNSSVWFVVIVAVVIIGLGYLAYNIFY